MQVNLFRLIIWVVFCTTFSFGQSEFQVYFDKLGVTGSSTIYDYGNQKWIYTDIEDAQRGTLPASTFKILNSLIALEYKVLKGENEIFKWDGIPKYHLGNVVEVWNQDTDLRNAYRNSTIWFYERIAENIAREKYKVILNELGYGNVELSQEGVDFWNYGAFAVTPEEQIHFLVKLYENKLPFSQETIETVKQLMITEQTETHIYRGKTGWTRKDEVDIGWFVGYLEINDEVYFFATRLLKGEEDMNPNFSKGRIEITQQILDDISNGKR